jgi:hypothetical protein
MKWVDVADGSIATKIDHSGHFRLSLNSGSTEDIALGPVRAIGLNRSRGRALWRATWSWMDDGSVLPDDEGPEAYPQYR